MFDFKKEINTKIKEELAPTLIEKGFVKCKPTTYVRECNGLLQYIYFKIEKHRLRPWVSYLPVFECFNCIVSFGTDGIYTSDVLNPYYGFSWVTLENNLDSAIEYQNYIDKVVPRFEQFKSSLVKGVLPEMDQMNSLDKFIETHKNNGLFFQKRAFDFICGKTYFDFIINVYNSSGKERLSYILKEVDDLKGVSIPAIVKDFLNNLNTCELSDKQADEAFEMYCNKIRISNKLLKS